MQARDASGAGLTPDELRAQANAPFIAAHETTAAALTWTYFLLAQHPEVGAERGNVREMVDLP